MGKLVLFTEVVDLESRIADGITVELKTALGIVGIKTEKRKHCSLN